MGKVQFPIPLEWKDISPEALASFRENHVKLAELVADKFSIDHRFCCDKSREYDGDFFKNINDHFGKTLLAIYQFQLKKTLWTEFSWLVNVLTARAYDSKDIDTLVNSWMTSIHAMIKPGLAGELSAPLLLLRQKMFFAIEVEMPVSKLDGEQPKKFLNLVMTKKRREAAELAVEMTEEVFHFRLEKFWQEVLAPCLQAIGLLWQRHQLGVGDEHAITEICRYVVFRVCDSLPRAKPMTSKAFISCVPGEEHVFVSEVFSELMTLKGWQALYLGRGAPSSDIVQAAVDYQPEVIILSVSLVRNLPGAWELLCQLKREFPEMKIILGGSAACQAQDILRQKAEAVIPDLVIGYSKIIESLGKNAEAGSD